MESTSPAGLYSPGFERDSCGFGLVADLLSVNRRLLEDIQASNRQRDWQAP